MEVINSGITVATRKNTAIISGDILGVLERVGLFMDWKLKLENFPKIFSSGFKGVGKALPKG